MNATAASPTIRACAVLLVLVPFLAVVSEAPAAPPGLLSPEASQGVGSPNQPDGVVPAEQPYARFSPPATSSAAPAPADLHAVPPPHVIAATFVVTTEADTGSSSLRAAIAAANANPGTDLITFAIPGGGVRTIRPTSALPTITQPVVLDGTTQPGFAGSPLIEIDGSLIPEANGLLITAGNSTVRGLIVNRFRSTGGAGFGILIDVNGLNVIEGNWIGLDATGTGAAGNAGNGIAVFGTSTGNLIGGITAAARNVVSGNGSSGIAFSTGNVGGNIARGNWVGLNVAGTAAVPNGGNGIFMNSSNNLIGGTTPGSRNIISGNLLPNVFVGFSASATIIQGNWIGTDATGAVDVGNPGNGINMDRASNTTIGGATPEARNVITGSDLPNIYVFGPASGTKILGNYIGTDVTGTVALGDGNAVVFDNAANNQLGGTAAGEGNLISGHRDFTAVVIVNAGATGNLVRGNRIGTNAAGTAAVPNFKGILVSGAARNVIGGPAAGDRNVVSGNETYGIEFRNSNNSRASGNFVGTDVTGLLDVGNKLHGIVVIASIDTIGGTSASFGNVVAFNGRAGIYDSTGTANLMRFNRTFSNRSLGIDLFPRGIAANDSLDGDAGANEGQNFPILDSVVVVAGTSRIHGRIDSKPTQAYTIDFYRSAAPDTAHFGEGQEHLGTQFVVTDFGGRAPFVFDPGVLIPDSAYVTAIVTDNAGNTSEFSQTLCLADRDEDGIRDCWEAGGWPVDVNSDGRYDLDLSALGASENFVDVFVEIDAMNGYAPPPAAINDVQNAFFTLPAQYLVKPAHVQGISLWPQISDTTIAVRNLPNRWPDFHAVRDSFFGTQAERADPNARWILQAKKMFYRYGLWARTQGDSSDTTFSGYGEGWRGNGGNDFMVTFGSVCTTGCWNNTKDVDVHAGTFMHEMGHTFGLAHGGRQGWQYKPNYYSVMNYMWQTPYRKWQKPGSWRLDYSRYALDTLEETSLDESVGLNAPADIWPVVAIPFTDSLGNYGWTSLAPGAVADWTGDSSIVDNRQVNINFGQAGQTLRGHQDWQNLVVNFRHSVNYVATPEDEAVVGEEEPLIEMTPAVKQMLESIPPPKPNGIFVMDGQRDPGSMLVGSAGGMNLYAALRAGPLGTQLYLAADGAVAGRDQVVFVAGTPGALRPSPLGKAGQVAGWAGLLDRRGTANTGEWQDEAGSLFESIVTDSAGSFLEGVVHLDLLLGEQVPSCAVALAAYGSSPGGSLLAQVPEGDGNGSLEADEWFTLSTSNVGVPGLPSPVGVTGRIALSTARPNPALSGVSRVQLSLPAAGQVVATVVDVAGRTVTTLVRGRLEAGEHSIAWNPLERGGRKPAPGVYFIVVRALGEERTARVVVL